MIGLENKSIPVRKLKCLKHENSSISCNIQHKGNVLKIVDCTISHQFEV